MIFCPSAGPSEFRNSECIEVKNLEFIGCSGIKVWNVKKIIIEESSFLLGNGDNGSMFNVYQSRAYIIWSNFAENKDGRVLYLYHSIIFAEVINCIFSKNRGGVVVAIYSDIFVNRSLFYNNSIENSSEVGVTIYALQSKLIVHKSNFSHNLAKESDAAAIYALDTVSVTIYKCHFNKNVAEFMAGAVFIMRGESSIVQNTIFSGNLARNGGALVIKLSLRTVSSSTIQLEMEELFLHMCESSSWPPTRLSAIQLIDLELCTFSVALPNF